jgi:predicted component of type VI protein secretion system
VISVRASLTMVGADGVLRLIGDVFQIAAGDLVNPLVNWQVPGMPLGWLVPVSPPSA